jgi:hypothetical protein
MKAVEGPDEVQSQPEKRKVNFDVSVTRGVHGSPQTKSSYDVGESELKMNPGVPFGLVGIDMNTHSLLVNNLPVSGSNGGAYSAYLANGLWEIPTPITFSAYYPYMKDIQYGNAYESYSLSYTTQETEAGPLVSKTVQRAVDQINRIPLEFQHITNDIGYKICDVTQDPQLQGLIHLRKVTATYVARAGVFVNDVAVSQGHWNRQGYYCDMVVFEGDAKLGVGPENELFIGKDQLVDKKSDSFRYYSIPDEIQMGKQTVEVVYDVDSFTVGGFTYPPMQGVTSRYSLYGLLPDNVFLYGKQYTFHLGMDLSKVYEAVVFSASVNDWQTMIYEDNEDF